MDDTTEERDEELEEQNEVVKKRNAAVTKVLEELRRQVRQSDMTQRDIEKQNGYARGYLSQVLNGHMSLTARHILAILFALDIPPGSFFSRLFPDPEGSPFEGPFSSGYGIGRPEAEGVLSEIRQRLASYDSAFEELRRKGVLSREGEPSDRPPPDDPGPH